MVVGILRLGLALETARRATSGRVGVFRFTVQTKESPAWTICGEHVKAVGRIPTMARFAVVMLPWTLALICTC
jgi:hypothetical protein